LNKKALLSKKAILIYVVIVVVIAAVGIYRFLNRGEELPIAPQVTVQQKKERFRQLLVPAVTTVYADLFDQYLSVVAQLESGESNNRIAELKKKYRVDSDTELLMALKPVPKSIALAQAAIESSWATSRFFTVANNVFGVWSFNEDEPRVAALKKRGDKSVWVKKYPSIKASVADYYLTLGRSSAFKEFRQLNMVSDDPFKLVEKLDRYSERGEHYGKELAAVIRYNKFTDYD